MCLFHTPLGGMGRQEAPAPQHGMGRQEAPAPYALYIFDGDRMLGGAVIFLPQLALVWCSHVCQSAWPLKLASCRRINGSGFLQDILSQRIMLNNESYRGV